MHADEENTRKRNKMQSMSIIIHVRCFQGLKRLKDEAFISSLKKPHPCLCISNIHLKISKIISVSEQYK